MTKNSTLKGLALGAVGALLASGVSVLPANAAGLADTSYITLKPSTGTEYTVLAAAGATFSLVANEASTVNIGNLKFLVSDPSGLVEPTVGSTVRSLAVTASDTAVTTSATAGDNRVTFDLSAASTIDSGSLVGFGDVASTTFHIASASARIATFSDTVSYVVSGADKTNGKFEVKATVASAQVGATVSEDVTVRVLREPRSTANTYVVDSGVNNAAANETLVLSADGSTTRVVEVTAWKDSNGNNKIDDNEYASPVRTITFAKPSEVVATTAMTPVVGDAKLTAKVSTVPVLNGEQVLLNDSDVVDVAFTRQGSAQTLFNKANTVTWDDDDKVFEAEVELLATSATLTGRSASTVSNDASWSDVVAPATPLTGATVTSASNKITFTYTAGTPHNLNAGDYVTIAGFTDTTYNVRYKIAAIPASNSFAVNTVTASPVIGGTPTYTVTTYDSAPAYYVGRVFAGTYTAQAYLAGAASGAKVEYAPQAAVSDEVEIATVGSASLQGKSFTAEGTNTTYVKSGTLAVSAKAVVYDADGDAIGAGRPVEISFTSTGDTHKVNGKTGTHTVMTDANGAVAIEVTALRGTAGATLTVKVSAEGAAATADIDFSWADASFSLIDLAKTEASITANAALTRTILKGGSYTFDFGVMDQWFTTAAAETYRIVVTGNGVTEGVKALTNGRASVTVTDNGLGSSMTTTIKLQKISSGTWGDVSSHTLTTNIQSNPGVVLGADGSALYGSAVDLSADVAAKALVELDQRLSTTAVPAYANNALINGKIVNKSTNVGQNGAEVVVSGPSNILFFNGNVYKRGSITVLADANGQFEVKLYSTTAQTDTVVTVTSMGASSTAKVTFTGAGVGEGKSLVITAPASVAPASTLQVKAKLTDTYGNAVQASAGRIKMTYTGAGIGFGTLPDSTDKNGELSYSVLLGAGDEGTITVVVSYDQNGDGDFVDTDDLTTTKTITVGAVEAEVNAVIGSFQGRWAARVENAQGSTVTVKVGGNWYKYSALNDNYLFSRKSKVGASVLVKVWVDGELQNEQTITIK